ncbi:phage tail tape measure protein [Streptomyces sp. NPDC086519]|uniref:phage tail tape measure protein n=1 Tax=Streptomyces sp. NPDC086519 TaxID=3154863 RepID=UPI0034283441
MAFASTGIRYDIIARDAASRTFLGVSRAAGRTDSTLAKLGKTARIAGEAVAVGLAAGLVEGTKVAVEFQSSMTRISTQAGATTKDVKVLSDQVLKLGTTTQQGPQALAESLYHLKSVGMDNVSAMKALKEASDLAAVGHANLEETTNALAGAWRTGIKGATSFHEAVSTVNAIIGAGNMSMDQFNAAIGTGILPSAKTFGLSMKQVGAALALMTDEGIDSASAATRLRMSFSLLGAPSGAAEKQLKKIGLTGLDLAEAMRGPKGLIGAISLLKDHLDKSGLSASRQSQLLSRAFGGGRSSSGILLLLNNLDVLERKQEQINKSTAKFDDAVKQQRKTAEAQWKLLTSNLEVMGIRVGTKVLPYVTDFVHYLATTAMPQAAKFGKTVEDLIPVDKIKKSISDAKTAVSDFLSGLKGPKQQKLPTPLLKAPDTVQLPKAPTSAAAGLGKTIHDAIAGGFKDIDWSSLGKTLGDGLGQAFQWLVSHGADLSKKLGDAIGKIDWVNVGKTLGVIALPLAIGFVDNLFEPMFHADFWKKHWLDTILAAISVVPMGRLGGVIGKLGEKVPWGKFGEALSRLPWGKLIPFSEKLAEAAGPILLKINEFVAKLALKFIASFAEHFPKIAAWFARELALLPIRLGVLGLELASRGSQAISRLSTSLLEALPGAGRKFIAAAWKAFGRFSLYQIGLNLAKSLISGAWSRLKDIGSWMKSHLVDPVVKWVKSGFGIASPSKVFATIGGNLISGLRNGVVAAVKGIGSWFTSHVKTPVVGAFRTAGSWLYSKGKDVTNGLMDGLQQPWKTLKKWVSGIAGWIKAHKGPISLDRKLLHPAGVALMHGLLSGLKFGFKGVGDFVYKVGDTVAGTVKGIASSIGLGNSSVSGAAQQFAQLAMKAKGWGSAEWPALKALWTRESGWNYKATNPTSGAYGIPQALPASKMASAGSDWRTNADTQIRWGLGYIKSRYGSPTAAWAHENKFGWYAKGGLAQFGETAWVGERGAELMQVTPKGTRIFNHADSMAMAKQSGIKLPGYASGTILNAADRVHRDKQRVEDAKDAVANAKRRHKGVAAAEKRLQAAEKELKAAEISLRNAQRSAKTSISNTIATGLLKTLSTGTSSAIASAVKSLATKLLNAGYTKTAASIQKKGARLESLADKRASIQKTIAAANQYAADQAGNINDFLSISGTSATSVGDLISQQQTQQKTASDFVKLSKSLKARGASKALIEQLAAAGPGSQLATILGDKSVTTQDIAKLNKLMASGGKLATGFGKDMADLMYDSGKDAGKGFLAGLKGQEKALGKQMAKLATDLVKQIKKALKIKSPSQVFRDEVGKNVVLGMAHGIDMHSHLVGAATQRLADTATGVSMRRRYVPTATSGRTGADQEELWSRLAAAIEASGSEVHVHFNDDRLRDLIDVQVKPKIKASEASTAYRAKVGRRNG